MKTFTVTVAYYDAWNEQTLVVEADAIEEACTKAIEIADSERVDHYQMHAWDPGVTFVAGIAEGGDPDDNDGPYALDNVIGGPIPFAHSEEAVLDASTLRNVLKTALVALESALKQDRASAHGDALEQLRAITAQIRSAIAGAER